MIQQISNTNPNLTLIFYILSLKIYSISIVDKHVLEIESKEQKHCGKICLKMLKISNKKIKKINSSFYCNNGTL